MSDVKPARLADDEQSPFAEVEGEIQAIVRRKIASDPPPQLDPGGEIILTKVNSLIERVSDTSAREMAKLITNLQSLRDFLHNESQRVQREIGGFVQLTEATLKATKVIAESMVQWKSTDANTRNDRR
jgi:hypothetical protein